MNANWFHRLEEGLIAFLLAAMTLITFAQVIARYVFNYSFTWALELAIFIFGGLIFLGLSYGVRVKAHIGVDALIKALPKKAARVTGIAACALCLVYTAIVFYGAWIYVDKMYTIGILAQDIPVPQWVPRLVLPVASRFYSYGLPKSCSICCGAVAPSCLAMKPKRRSNMPVMIRL